MLSDRKRFVEELFGIDFEDSKIPTEPPAPGQPLLRVVGDDGAIQDWDLEDVKAWMSQPRHPAGTKKGGQWSGGPSQSLYGPQMPGGTGTSSASGGGGGGSSSNFSMAFNNGTMQDTELRDIVKAKTGGDQHATVVSRDEFRSNPAPVMYRGVSDPSHVDSNLDGSWTGVGIYGNGNYFSNQSGEAADYAGEGGWIFSAKLAPGAKVVQNGDIEARYHQARQRGETDAKDLSHFAVTEGYDAINVPFSSGQSHIVVLNNKALQVNADSLPSAGKMRVDSTGEGARARVAALKAKTDEIMAQMNTGKGDFAAMGMAYSQAFQEMSRLEGEMKSGARRQSLRLAVEEVSQ